MEKSSTGIMILKTALIATAVILCAITLCAVLVFICFPFEGYKFADNMGMDKLALSFAENYEDDGNIDGLVYCIDKADKLLVRSGKASYAKKLVVYTEKFFSYDNAYNYFAQLDEYYNDEAYDIRIRVGLYSYLGHVIEENYKARTIIGEDDYMLFRGEPKPLGEILDDQSVTIMERSYIISSLSRQLLLGKSALVDVDSSGAMTGSISYEAAKNMTARQMASLSECKTDEMKYLYVMHGLYYFINGIKEFISNSALSGDWDIFLDKDSYPVDGMSLGEAYKQLFGKLNNKGGANEK